MSTVFDLPDRLAAKAAPDLIATDERHFAAIEQHLARTVANLSQRLAAELRAPGGSGQKALDRDQEIRRLSSRLEALRRYGLDLCLGRMVPADGGDPVYVGRQGLTDAEGSRLLVDWRSPAAASFFGATHADPMGLSSRRRYRWTRGRITDYWDEIFSSDAAAGRVALDDQSAFIASLAGSRSARMRDVLSTIQADQDAIIRADSRGALVVDGGPGTGKTVVALHRTAFLLYSDPRLARRHGGVLFLGPSPAYLRYVEDVLPSLGEDGVHTCTLRDLLPEGRDAGLERDPAVAALKSTREMVMAVERAVQRFERPPTRELVVETDWADVVLDAGVWADAFDAAEPGIPHNDAREQVWEELLAIIAREHDDEVPTAEVRSAALQNRELLAVFNLAWPLLDPAGLVADLWSVPELLRGSAPWLSDDEVQALRRDDPRGWTTADLPLLDAARARIGDPEATRRRQRADAELAVERRRRSEVLENLLLSLDTQDGESLLPMLRHEGLQDALVDDAAIRREEPDEVAGPFAHIVVDEAQELTDAEWQMVLRRCPSRSLTVVGDRAQARHGFPESWQERLRRIGLDRIALASLTINYRTPEEVMAVAAPVILGALPDVNVPTSIRASGIPVRRGARAELRSVLEEWLGTHDEGIATVIATQPIPGDDVPDAERVRVLTPAGSKGLEFDLVVLLDPESFGDGVTGAVDRYVAMTRATEGLVLLYS